MKISVINLTHGLLSDQEVQAAIRAVNRQIAEDFSPYWNLSGQLRLEGSSSNSPQKENPEDMRGDAVIYLWDDSNIPDALGYHDTNHLGVPYGFVFIDIAIDIGENWTVTFSHEALELIGDQQANILVQGPHPDPGPNKPARTVYHWREMCDAVQGETYYIDGVELSNFVLPLYFTQNTEPGSRNDFLGGRNLSSFGVNPGGYIGFYDPESKSHETYMEKHLSAGDKETVKHRIERKNKARQARRGNRYQADDAAVAKQKLVVAGERYKLKAKQGANLTILCKSEEIKIRSATALKSEKNKAAGYYSFDIRATAKSLNKEIETEDMEEVNELTFEIETVVSDIPVKAELDIKHRKDEAVLIMREMGGVLYWHKADGNDSEGGSLIDIPIPVISHQDASKRRGLIGKVGKVVVRVFKHKLKKWVGDSLKDAVTKYLTETLEKKAFKKLVAAQLKEFVVLPFSDQQNKKLGEIKVLKEPLAKSKRYLLFIHGIFSSTEGAFSDLLLSRYDDEFLPAVAKAGDYHKVIGFDHWTVAQDTLENAQALLKLLPEECEIDIVCHSRGAGVTRCLLEHTNKDLRNSFEQKSIKVGNVIYVAGACQGSQLALPEKIGSLVNVFSALSSLSGKFIPLQIFTGLLKFVQYGVEEFPGIAAMSPESPIFKKLNKPINQKNCRYIYIRSNYEPSGRIATVLDDMALDKFVFDGGNDLVVPYEGAGKFDDAVKNTIEVIAGYEYGVAKIEHVNHIQFFKQREVRDALLKYLKKV